MNFRFIRRSYNYILWKICPIRNAVYLFRVNYNSSFMKNKENRLLRDSRRTFLMQGSVLTGGYLVQPYSVFENKSLASWTVGQVMDKFIAEVPGAPFRITVDTLKSGNRDMVVSGIVTTMFATIPVIEKAIGLKSNFIIAHEPSYYNHLDETTWLENDEVYKYKADLLKKHNIAIWRNHDYIHRHQPDGVMSGVLADLGWSSKFNPESGKIKLDTGIQLNALIKHLKSKLNINTLRFIGDPDQVCQDVLLMPGASGGRGQIELIGAKKPDVAICGEIQEWETAEYIRDARAKGQKISFIILGHIPSEEAGSAYMVEWIKKNLPDIKATHVPAGNPFSYA